MFIEKFDSVRTLNCVYLYQWCYFFSSYIFILVAKDFYHEDILMTILHKLKIKIFILLHKSKRKKTKNGTKPTSKKINSIVLLDIYEKEKRHLQ